MARQSLSSAPGQLADLKQTPDFYLFKSKAKQKHLAFLKLEKEQFPLRLLPRSDDVFLCYINRQDIENYLQKEFESS